MPRRVGPGAARTAAALLGLLAACGGEAAPERPEASAAATGPAAAPPSASSPSPVPARPALREGTIVLEGSVEPMTYHLYRSPAGFAPPFSTYVPADMRAESRSSGEGEAVRFVAAFAGTRNERAFLHVSVLPAGTPEAEVRERFAAASGGTAAVPPGERAYAWALAERAGQSGGTSRHAALGEHGGHYFYLLAEYPAEMGDGMGPRLAEIVREWRWTEDGTPLGAGA